MKLFHGSTLEITEPKLIHHGRNLDFGQGFYTTSNEQQAQEFAQKVFIRRMKEGHPTVSSFEISDNSPDGLKVLSFDEPNEAWLDFVVKNRQGNESSEFDIVIGPVANDDVLGTIVLFEGGQIDEEAAIKAFKVKNLYNQYVFKSSASLSHLKFINSYEVSDND